MRLPAAAVRSAALVACSGVLGAAPGAPAGTPAGAEAKAARSAAERREALSQGLPDWRTERRRAVGRRLDAEAPRDRWRWPMLLESGDPARIARANRALRKLPPEKNGLVEHLVAEKLYGDRLEPRTLELMHRGTRRVLADPEAWPYKWTRWLTDPDHFPEKPHGSQSYIAAMVGVVGGEVLGDPELVEAGRRLLRALLVARNTYGEDAEYNSPSYTPLGLTHLALLADLADDPESRRLARWLLAQRMLVLLGRYHPPSQQVGGPHQRSYAPGQLGIGKANLLLNDVAVPGGVVHDVALARRYDGGFQALRHLWLLARWPLPDYVERVATGKPLPQEVHSTSRDRGYALTPDGRRTFREQQRHHITYLAPDYVLATTRDLTGNQPSGNPFLAQWPRRELVRSRSDFRLLWTYYALDDEGPFQKRLALRRGGIFRTVQHENKTLMIFHPKDRYRDPTIRTDTLKLVLLLTAPEEIEELVVGEQRIGFDALPVAFPEPEPVYLADGRAYAAILPTRVDDRGRPHALRLHLDEHGFLEIAYYNHAGEPIEIPMGERHRYRAGFAFEIAGRDEYESLAAFRAHMEEAKVSDEMVEGIRQAAFQSGADSLRLRFDPKREHLLARQVNGRELEVPLFRSATAALARAPRIELGAAILTSDGTEPLWLVKDPADETYAVWNHSGREVDLELRTPSGSVEARGFGVGNLVLRPGPPAVLEWEQLPGAEPELDASEGIRVERAARE